MKPKSLFSLCLASVLFSICFVIAVGQEKTTEVKLSDDEIKALNALNALTDTAAKVDAVAEFIKKFPKTPIRAQLAENLAADIAKIKEPSQAIPLAEKAQTIFTTDEELEGITGVLLDAYVTASRADDVFRVGGAIVAKRPDDAHAYVQMTFVGANELRKGNQKFAQQALQSGLKAVELIEADKKPEGMEPANWASHKALLPQIYQQLAILSLVTGNSAEALARATKATVLGPSDPTGFALVGMVVNNEYLQMANAHKSMAEGPEKAASLKKLEGLMDQIIDAYAHAVALSVGKQEHQALMQQLTVDLTSYYKYRHNGSTEGLQELIDKYKPKP